MQNFLTFKAVVEAKNITSSANKLQMSQPGISMQIKSLEREYGARFFTRTNKGVNLTHEGQIFYAHILSVLDLLSEAKKQISSLAKDQRKLICIGATSTITEYILPNVLAFLHKTHPNVDFKIKVANTESITHDTLEKNIHIGLVDEPAPKRKGLKIIGSFWEDELVVVVPYFHPWSSKKSISITELPNQRLITREESSGTRKVMEKALKEMGFDLNQLNVTLELGSTQAIKQLVSAGLGITILSSLTVNRECDQRKFRTLKINGTPIYRPLSIITNPQIIQPNDECILINLLNNHRLLSDVLCKDNNLAYA